MESINQWLVELNRNNPLLFAIVTILTVSGTGVAIAVLTELFFKLLGIKGERIEIHH
jgi:hypothetical protein